MECITKYGKMYRNKKKDLGRFQTDIQNGILNK